MLAMSKLFQAKLSKWSYIPQILLELISHNLSYNYINALITATVIYYGYFFLTGKCTTKYIITCLIAPRVRKSFLIPPHHSYESKGDPRQTRTQSWNDVEAECQ